MYFDYDLQLSFYICGFVLILQVKIKCKFRSTTGHEGREEE